MRGYLRGAVPLGLQSRFPSQTAPISNLVELSEWAIILHCRQKLYKSRSTRKPTLRTLCNVSTQIRLRNPRVNTLRRVHNAGFLVIRLICSYYKCRRTVNALVRCFIQNWLFPFTDRSHYDKRYQSSIKGHLTLNSVVSSTGARRPEHASLCEVFLLIFLYICLLRRLLLSNFIHLSGYFDCGNHTSECVVYVQGLMTLTYSCINEILNESLWQYFAIWFVN